MRVHFAALVALLAAPALSPALAQMHGHGAGGHDERRMPGLRGVDTTQRESAEMMVMFHHFDMLTREVENLPNGIRTVTSSRHPMVMNALVSHVTGMITRVEEGRDPKVVIQSPTLDIFFERREALVTDIEVTEAGIIVTQTSDDPELVAALQTHAEEVSDMVSRGMAAVHERLQKQAGGQ